MNIRPLAPTPQTHGRGWPRPEPRSAPYPDRRPQRSAETPTACPHRRSRLPAFLAPSPLTSRSHTHYDQYNRQTVHFLINLIILSAGSGCLMLKTGGLSELWLTKLSMPN